MCRVWYIFTEAKIKKYSVFRTIFLINCSSSATTSSKMIQTKKRLIELITYQIAWFAIRKLADSLANCRFCVFLSLVLIKERKEVRQSNHLFRKFSDLMQQLKNCSTSLTTYQIACFAIRKIAERRENCFWCVVLFLVVNKEIKR